MNIDTLNLKEIKEWVDEEGYLDNVYDPVTENTFYWLIARVEKLEEILIKIKNTSIGPEPILETLQTIGNEIEKILEEK